MSRPSVPRSLGYGGEAYPLFRTRADSKKGKDCRNEEKDSQGRQVAEASQALGDPYGCAGGREMREVEWLNLDSGFGGRQSLCRPTALSIPDLR